MIIYILAALLPLCVVSNYNKLPMCLQTVNRRNSYLFWTLAVLFLIIGFRHESMGTDTIGYLEDFYRFSNLDWKLAIEDTRQEPGFVIFTKVVGLLTNSAEVYQLVYTLLYFVCYYQFLKQFDGNLPFYFLFFFVTLGEFMFFFTGVRQCIAISLCLFSFKYILEKKWYYFAFIILIAYHIHHSVVLFGIVYLMANLKVTKFNMSLYLVIMYFASKYLVSAQMYLNEKLEYNYEIEQADSGMIFLMLISILSFFSYIYVVKNNLSNKLIGVLFNVNIITLFFWLLRLQTRVAERPSFYFLPFSCVLFAYLIKNTRVQILRFGFIAVPFIYYIYRFYTTFRLFNPYRTFLFE